jgi:molybdopterin converting factor small subunit
MAITVQIPPPMRELTGGKIDVPVTGDTVKACLDDLVAQFPAFKPKLFNASGVLHPHINILVNDEDIRFLDDADTAVTSGQIVAILPAVAGG